MYLFLFLQRKFQQKIIQGNKGMYVMFGRGS
uniref:Uncharacterized protein n=1 Tax=Arundo donax TaxID=35708 RepID=A0A0A9AIU0_ARUDO